MPGSPSIAPKRTAIIVGSAGFREKSAEPHRAQKHFSNPLSGAQTPTSSAPSVRTNDPGASRAETDDPTPVRRWQRVQWQYIATSGGSSTAKRTAPQPQPPVRTGV